MASVLAFFSPPQIQFLKPTLQFQHFSKPNHSLQNHAKFLKPTSFLQSKKNYSINSGSEEKAENYSTNSGSEEKADDPFFKDFLHGVKENLFLDAQTSHVKLQHWKSLAELSLSSLSLTSLFVHEYDEGEEGFCIVFQSKMEKICMGEKGFIHKNEEDLILHEKKYFDMIVEKKKEFGDQIVISKDIFDKAKTLKGHIQKIRGKYSNDVSAKDVLKIQIAVVIYLIDRLAFRGGYEKDDDGVQTLACSKLRVGDVQCLSSNKMKVKIQLVLNTQLRLAPPIWKAIGQLQMGKSINDALFHDLSTTNLKEHLNELVPGLTPKLFHVYNASITFDEMLAQQIRGDLNQKILVYQQASKKVMERYLHSREALDMSKINYMDPRITVAWCKRHGVPIDKIFNRFLLAKYVWAMDANSHFRF